MSKKGKEKLKDVKAGALGIGDAYAYAVQGLVGDAKGEKGSNQESWLGKSKVSLDAKSCVDSEMLHGKRK